MANILKRRARKHGTRYVYVMGCRCPKCKAANVAYQNNYNQKQRDKV